MNFAIAFAVWLIVGTVINLFLTRIAITKSKQNGTPGVSILFIIFSFVRMYAIVLVIKMITNNPAPDTMYLSVCIADVVLSVLTAYSCMRHFGEKSTNTMAKTGQSIGSILFLVYYLIRF